MTQNVSADLAALKKDFFLNIGGEVEEIHYLRYASAPNRTAPSGQRTV